MEKTGCKIIYGAPTTLAVKGLMMMMRPLVEFLYIPNPANLNIGRIFMGTHAAKPNVGGIFFFFFKDIQPS